LGVLRVLLSLLFLLPLNPASLQAAEPQAPVRWCHTLVTDEGRKRPVCIDEVDYFGDVCRAISRFARQWRLPEGFLARLIWQESRFDPNALSTAGAEGIAQFIPSTARLRGLSNPFNPAEALARSAEYLRFLADRFGNLGLAAAAYNGGEGRLARYTRVGGYLPAETEAYVEIITGAAADVWRTEPPAVNYALSGTVPFIPACIEMAKAAPMPRLDLPPGEWHPWGVLIAQDFSQSVARRRFERVQARFDLLRDEPLMLLTGRNLSMGTRLRHFAMIGRDSRDEALELCRAITKAGGVCTVRKN
jgi:hypothetical protein